MGLPLPGETTLLPASALAAGGKLSIVWVIVAAASGAIVGGILGYLIGRQFGFRLALHYGRRVGLTEARLKVGQLLFRRHGSKLVFFGRFVAVLRVLAAVLAGANCMEWRLFLIFNAARALLLAVFFGTPRYLLGEAGAQFSRLICIARPRLPL